MANTKVQRKDVDRFTGQAITNVGKNTPAQQKAVEAINAAFKGGKSKKPTPTTKKK